jgi:hypothetical protein
MWHPRREDRLSPQRYEAARVELSCPATTAHGRSLMLEDAVIYADGWARWLEAGHVYVGYVQARPGCDPPTRSAL